MRSSDWSSDVCSSDLALSASASPAKSCVCGADWVMNQASAAMPIAAHVAIAGSARWTAGWRKTWVKGATRPAKAGTGSQIGRAAWRDRVGRLVEISVVARSFKKQNKHKRPKKE